MFKKPALRGRHVVPGGTASNAGMKCPSALHCLRMRSHLQRSGTIHGLGSPTKRLGARFLGRRFPQCKAVGWWRRRESNPRPKIFSLRHLHACPEICCLAGFDPLGHGSHPANPLETSRCPQQVRGLGYPANRRLIPHRRRDQVRRWPLRGQCVLVIFAEYYVFRVD